jgi:mRNA interferase MazF
VIPLTTNTTRVHPFQVLLKAMECGLPRDAKAQAEQIRSVAVERIGRRPGQVPPARMAELNAAIRLRLGL